jgi:hypothetical protein
VSTKTVREALQYVADHPQLVGPPIEAPAWELIAHTLFEVANSPDAKVRGSMARATKAQRMIADRLVGTRRPGTSPAVKREQQIEFADLTAGVIAGD